MGRHLLLPGLLLFLPLIGGWMISNCLLIEDWLPRVSRFPTCPVDSRRHFLISCFQVKNVTQTLEVVPRNVQGLCLSGSVSLVLSQDAFANFPGLKALGLSFGLPQLLPGALRGLAQLQQLSFMAAKSDELFFLPSDAFSDLRTLQKLSFSGLCLAKNMSVQLPPKLRQLSVTLSCLQDVGELAYIFPDLIRGASSGNAWTLDLLDLSRNRKLKNISSGSLQGLSLGTLCLEHTQVEAAAVMGLGLQRLDKLVMTHTRTLALPADVVAHLELQHLHLGINQIKSIAPKALPSCHSLKSLHLQSTGLTELPPGFLAAMPRLQRLNLAYNQLQSVLLCADGTGAMSELWALDMSSNGLHTLPPATFSCLPQLRELILQGNQLTYLDGQEFQGLPRLTTLDLKKNPLVSLGEGWLAPLPALTTLNLLDTHVVLSSARDLQGPENLHDLRLQLPSGPSGVALSLPTSLTSLELHVVWSRKPWVLASPVFPVLQTLTLEGGGLQLGSQNISELFPALRQLSLKGHALEALCSQGLSHVFLWQLHRLQYLKVQGPMHNFRPCRITGLPGLQELQLKLLQSNLWPHPLQLEELVGDLPRLQVLMLANTGLKSLSAAAFQGLSSLKALVLDGETHLVLDDSLQEHSLQMPPYLYITVSTLACSCANAWVEPWLKQSPKTYVYFYYYYNHVCPLETGGQSKSPLFPFLQGHCPQTLGLELFVGCSLLLLLLIALPLLQEARNSWVLYLQAWLRAWLQGLCGQKGEGRRFLYDVFVSYCEEDQGWVVQELLPALEGCPPTGRGLRLCLPERDFEPGKDVADNIADSMAGSRVTLCVMSHQALHTPRCRLELRLATSLVLAAPQPPVLLLVFLERISRHQLPPYHRLAWLLRRGDYCLWLQEEEKKHFWDWLGSRLSSLG
ncbi:toll-like receptor 12 isoform X1 [Ochotona princeps]|uniref:toll-like receptor 12 isoform X1 n=2 Tax=Ochotona princeps TaxID=9978 RepID=UPI00271461E7|nr:toll-like receptor 12 isoform X1 [Ochotona princeps]